MNGLECRVVLSRDDFAIRNHRVQGASLLPGAAMLDLLYRVLHAAGEDTGDYVLRDVTFTGSVAGTAVDHELRCAVGTPVAGVRRVRLESRELGPPGAGSPWREVLTAELVEQPGMQPPPIDLATVRAAARQTGTMAQLYATARAAGIVHDAPMRCTGDVHSGAHGTLGELRPERPASHDGGFHLHPAILDAATLVGFHPGAGAHGGAYVPMALAGFRVVHPARGACVVHVPRPPVVSVGGELVTSDFSLHDQTGRFLAGLTGLTWKHLGGGSPGYPGPEPSGQGAAEQRFAGRLREMVAGMLGRPAGEVDPSSGFYDLGLDSLALLQLGRDLEGVIGESLYPTLLFEYGTIDSLAAHLKTTYRIVGADAPASGQQAEVATEDAVPSFWVDRWVTEDAPARPAGCLVVVGPRWLTERLNGVPGLVPVVPDTRIDLGEPGPYRLDPADGGQVKALLAALRRSGDVPRDVAVFLPADRDVVQGCLILWAWATALLLDDTAHARLTIVCAARPGTSVPAALGALARTCTAETPQIRCRVVAGADPADPERCAEVVLGGAADDSAEPELDLTATRRVRRWEPALPEPVTPVLREEGVYLVTGGAGGLAGLLTDHLVGRYRAKVVLVGRRPVTPELRDRLDRWRLAGGDVRTVQADVTDAAQVERAIGAAREAFGRINGVVHAAAQRRDGVYFTRQDSDLAAVLAPKMQGVVHLDAATAGDRLDFFVVFSSLAAAVPNPGQSGYAAANAVLEAFVRERSTRPDRAGRSLAIGWPYWAQGGMQVSDNRVRRREGGLRPMSTTAGLAAFEQALSSDLTCVTILNGVPGVVEALLPQAPVSPACTAPPVSPAGTRPSPGAGLASPVVRDRIAVIGLAGRYPQAANVDEFWRNLVDGVDCITEVPADRWDHELLFDPVKGAPGRTYGRWGGFLDGVDRFDPAFFGISRREAERMDPQERLFLSTCWQTLEDAGYPPEALRGHVVGVFAGIMWNHYQLVTEAFDGVAPTAMHTAVPNRVSHMFDLSGPSLAVDTACSSSLTALHLAVASLQRGECELALAGGVNATVHPQKYLQLAQGHWLSTDGRCRSFGQGGSGYVPGEGVGAVLLKPLALALRDGDHVYGVIGGSAVNHGGRTSGVTVPSPVSQAALIGSALRDAGWDAATVGYVEAHGTGTALGDPIEIEGLNRAFAGARPDGQPCLVGSVKSNIGHLESAAGIAGITKVLLQLRHGQIAPSLHSAPPNPHIDFAATPFVVPERAVCWHRPADGLRRAGISAFGAGGANAHVLIEEAQQLPRTIRIAGGPRLCVLSARDEDALRDRAVALAGHLRHRLADRVTDLGPRNELADRLAAHLGVPVVHLDGAATLGDLGIAASDLATLLDGLAATTMLADLGLDHTLDDVAARLGTPSDTVVLADISYTLQVGRTPMACRLAVVCDSLDALATALDRHAAGAPAAAGEFWGGGPGVAPAADECIQLFRSGRLADVARAWVAGADVPWADCYPATGQDRPRRTSLPGYPFREERCWVGHWASTARSRTPQVVEEPCPTAAEHEPADVDEVELRVLEGGVGLVTIRALTFTASLITSLENVFATIAATDAIKAVVVTGGERLFSMGGSVQALTDLASGARRFTDAPFVYEGLLRCDRPVVCAMRGHASGGGLAFGLYADVVVLSADADYRANFLSYGFTPGLGATYILEQRLGAALASEMLLTGRALRGDELARRGANVTVVPGDRVLSTALELARSMAGKPEAAVRALKVELARRVLERLSGVVDSEVAMHEQVLDKDAARLVAQRLRGPQRGSQAHLEPVEPVEPVAQLRDAVVETLGRVLFLEPHEVDPTQSFTDMGLDSVGAVEVVGQLNRRFGTDLDSTAVYDHPTVTELVAAVATDLGSAAAMQSAAVTQQPVVVQAPVAGITSGADPDADPPPRRRVQLSALDRPALAVSAPAEAHCGDGDGDGGGDPGSHIAVIGMSGRFSDADDLDAFWANLAEGRCSIREVSRSRWDVTGSYDPDRRAAGHTYSKWAALLDDVETFDAEQFGRSPLEAESMDPQQRLFLQEAWRALQDAGYAGDGTARRRWGVFAGCAAGDYADLLTERGMGDTAHAFLGNAPSVLPARIAYQLNLGGPAVAVDTACSASLVAVDMACASLLRGESDMALAGGVAVMCTPKMHIWTSRTGMLSPTGRCRPFDVDADGIVLGEAAGVVVLKKLDRALTDGDHIHGVILASGVNGDGRTNGITAPSALAQAELIARVHERAGIAPAELGYIEAHGTGTELGDPIEVRALNTVLGQAGLAAGSCALGSVKGNIGHTTVAAGIAGLLKVLLALRHGQLPPSLGYRDANPHIDFGAGPLAVQQTLTRWPVGPAGRRVGAVSSFGFSGVNAHVVVTGAPPARRATETGGLEVVVVSARDEEELRGNAADLTSALRRAEATPAVADVAYTLAVGRRLRSVRAVTVVEDPAGLLTWLDGVASGAVPPVRNADAEADDPADLAAAVAAARASGGPAALRAAAQRLARGIEHGMAPHWPVVFGDRPLRRVALPPSRLRRQRHWVPDPAAVTNSMDHPLPGRPVGGGADVVAAYELQLGPRHWLVTDHRVGGTPMLPAAAGIRLVVAAAIADGLVAPLRLRSLRWPRPLVATGDVVARVEVRDKRGGRTVTISSGAGEHVNATVTQIDPVVESFDLALVQERCPLSRPVDEIYAGFAAGGLDYRGDHRALTALCWGDGEALGTLRTPATTGPAAVDGPALVPAVLDAALQAAVVLIDGAAGVGGPLLPFAVESVEVLDPAAVPRYTYLRRVGEHRFDIWIAGSGGLLCVRMAGLVLRAAQSGPAAGFEAGAGVGPDAIDMIFVPDWRPVPDRPRVVDTLSAFAVLGEPGDPLVHALVRQHPSAVAVVARTVDAATLWADLADPVDRVYVVLPPRDPAEQVAVAARRAVFELFELVAGLAAAGWSRRPLTLVMVLRGAVACSPGETPAAEAAGLLGLAGAIRAEHPRWRVGCVDIGAGDPADVTAAGPIVAEDCTEQLVALRDGARLLRHLAPATLVGDPTGPGFRRGGTYLILGGAGGLGQVLGRHLAGTYGARLALLGRRPEDEQIRAAVAGIAQLGGQAVYLRADATDPDGLRDAVAQARSRLGRFDGAIHAAMVLRDRALCTMDESDLDAALAPKTIGAVALVDALRQDEPELLLFFSSAVSFTAAAGQANYAAASTFEDAFALSLRAQGLPTTVVNWGYWGGTGAVTAAGYRERFTALGIAPIDARSGIAALERVLGSQLAQAVIVTGTADGLAALGVEQRPTGALERAVTGYAELGACSRLLLARRLLELPAMPAKGQRTDVDALAEQLSIAPSQQRLFDAVLDGLARAGVVRRDEHLVEIVGSVPPADPTADLKVRYPELTGHVTLLRRCIRALPDVLAGTVRGVEVLFPGGSTDLLDGVYQGNAGADFHHRLLAEQIAAAAAVIDTEHGRPAEILEIGAGTGATTQFVLEACRKLPQPPRLRFTDISPSFQHRAREQLGSRYPNVEFGEFDVERDPVEQGLPAQGFDLVYAANVLHATAEIGMTLAHVATLLRPGGLLMVNEVTAASDFLTVTFGLTPGWWRFRDPGRRLGHAPLLGASQWRAAFAEAGFSVLRARGLPGTPEDRLEQVVFVTRRETAPAAATATPGAVPAAAAARAYVRQVLAEVLKFGDARLDVHATFDAFGMDSLVGIAVLDRFERDLGELPSTLLFQHTTIEDLAAYFLRNHAERLVTALGEGVVEAPRAATAQAIPAGAPRSGRPDDIAVIGVTGRYPGSPDLHSFWHNIVSGVNCVTEVPRERFDPATVYDPQQGRPEHSNGRWGGFLDGVDQFDPGFFGILPRDAAGIDPQERLFLEAVWTLLQDAGYLARATAEPATGVFVGTMYGTYGQIAAATGWSAGRFTAGHSPYWSIANRVSYTLDLHGPSFAVDSACSSSLTAVHLAVQSLRRGECRMAVAGGVNLVLHQAHLVALASMRMLSSDGACKTFDERADGFAPGEGVGAVLLKPLAAAEADGDDIWAVIKESHVNAGGRTPGYTVPNPKAQAGLIAETVRRSDIDPCTLGYVEAHGTGTSLGDPIELAALAEALHAVGAPQRCAVGSVKAIIGHLEGAAGIAGLTKVLLQLRERRIAPCAQLSSVNPKIDLRSSPLYLPTDATEWVTDGPRRAGVSSFGAGGANAHVVVEEYVRPDPDAMPGGEQLVLLSARTPGQLHRAAADLATMVDDDPGLCLATLARTSQVGRAEFAERLAVLATTRAELVERLRTAAQGRAAGGACRGTVAGDAAAPLDEARRVHDLLAGRRLGELAEAWVDGTPVDWRQLWPGRPPARVRMPVYPFEKRRYWLPDPLPAPPASQQAAYRLLRPVWRPQAAGSQVPDVPRTVLVVADGPVADAVTERLSGLGVRCLRALPTDDIAALLATMGPVPDALVHAVVDPAEGSSVGAAVSTGFTALFRAARALLAARGPDGLRLVTGIGAASGVAGAARAAIPAMLRSLALEHSRFAATSVSAPLDWPADWARLLVDELCATRTTGPPEQRMVEVCHSGGDRLVRDLDVLPPPAAGAAVPVRAGATYLITGGAGALGRVFARHLSGAAAVTVVLAGRTRLDRAELQRLAGLAGSGSRVVYRRADLTDRDQVRDLIAEIGAEAPLRGVIHAAGSTRDALAVRKADHDVAEVLAPKVDATVYLDEATAGEALDFFVLFSSVAARTGNLGQSDYAYANAFLDEFAALRARRVAAGERSGASVSICWPLWGEGGMTVDAATRALLAHRWGSTPLGTAEGLAAYDEALAAGQPCVVVTTSGARPDGPASAPPAPAIAAPKTVAPKTVAPETVAPETVARPAATEQLLRVAEADLRRMAAGFLLVEERHIDLGADLMDAGFDSISLTELINQVNERYDLELLPTVLFETVNLAAFAQLLVAEHGSALAATLPTTAPPPVVAATGSMPVAVVGMAGLLPGCADLAQFWAHLAAGHDLTGPLPADRADLLADSRTAGVRGGFLDDVRSFDAGLFGISPREASTMDPRQRLFLQTVWRAAEDAGYAPSAFAGTNTGLFAGVSACDYDDLMRAHDVPIEAHSASGIANCILVNRVSYLLDLHGPSEALDTACSSSMVAVHRAVRAIRAGECDAAFAGGVNLLLSPGLFVAFDASGMLSADGRCKTFAEDADGYGRGEGVGVVLLKSLDRALADGDDVYAIIRGTAVNHGGRSPSLTAPNVVAQARVVEAAYRDAGVDPATVGYVETHGTGTRLGDPVEVEALKKAFSRLGAANAAGGEPWVALGSVKSNIGHLESASGIAGLLKVLLCLRHRQLPPTLNVGRLNPYIELDGSPLFVNRQLRDWAPVLDGGAPVLRAGISSFGFGGTNAHVVCESGPRAVTVAEPATAHTFVLSAPSATALAGYAERMARFLAADPSPSLARVAHTLRTGRQQLEHRCTFRTDNHEQAVRMLRGVAADAAVEGVRLEVVRSQRTAAGSAAPLDEQPAPTGLRRLAGMPSFPFDRTTYWLPGPEPTGSPQEHPPPTRQVRTKLRLAPARAGHVTAPVGRTAVGQVVPAPAEPVPTVTATASAAAAPGVVLTAIVGRLAGILGLDPGHLDGAESFTDLGLDSIFRMDLVRWINQQFGLNLNSAELYEHDSASALATLVEQAATADTRAGVTPGPQALDTGVAPAPTTDGPAPELRERLELLISGVVGRPLVPGATFIDNGFTSFDMLRVVNDLDKRFGAQRKTLLFDHPTLDEVAAELHKRFGTRAFDLLAAPGCEESGKGLWADPANAARGPLVVLKRSLAGHEAVAVAMDRLNRDHGMEGGLAGRDIAPFVLLGSERKGYFNVSIRGDVLFAWSYVGPEDHLRELAAELVGYSRGRGLRPNFLALSVVDDVAGEAFTATPFGAVQRIDDLAAFSLRGSKMSRLRYMVRRFERHGACRTAEYRSGDNREIDAQVAAMLDQWTGNKQMVNPYLTVVRNELQAGALHGRHRLFLTYRDDKLLSAVVITRLPSAHGWLLDLEFYPVDAPMGGLEYAIVRIIDQLVREGATQFSLGASFGVSLGDSSHADRETERELAELRSVGIFGAGNFQFKSKFRPTNMPLYLCQPAGAGRTPVSEIILLIADPELTSGPCPAAAVAASPAAQTNGPAARQGNNPLAVPHDLVGLDLLTDSWAELDGKAIRTRMDRLTGKADRDEVAAAWLPFPHATLVASGRAAEALLCTCWPDRRGQVLHNGLFPTWLAALVKAGFTAVPMEPRPGPPADGAIPVKCLADLLERSDGEVSFVCVELSPNARGGYPVPLDDLAEVRRLADAHGVRLVLDATRVVENAAWLAEEGGDRELWQRVRDLLAFGDAATFSLTKDFGVTAGGLLAVRQAHLADAVAAQLAADGRDLSLAGRKIAAAALADTDEVARLVRERMDAVRGLWRPLHDAGLPVAAPGGHCVLLDTARLPGVADHPAPVVSALAWILDGAQVRGAPHLGETPELRGWIRFAVPLGLPAEQAAAAGARIASLLTGAGRPPVLVATGPPATSPASMRYRVEPPTVDGPPVAEDDPSTGTNLSVLREQCPVVRRVLTDVPGGGRLEAFIAGTGPTLVLMPPFNIGAGVFARQFAALTARHQVVCVHHPGVGASTGVTDITLDAIADLVTLTLDELGVAGPVHVAGASFGGLIALTFALRHPQRCLSLALIGSSFQIGNRVGGLDKLDVVARADFDSVLAAEGTEALAAARPALQTALLRCESMDPAMGLRYLDVFAARPNLSARLGDIDVPALVVQGGRDTVISLKTAHLLHGALPRCRFVELPTAGHFPFLTHADELNRVLAEFLSAVEEAVDR